MPEFTFNGNDLSRLTRMVYSPGIPSLSGSSGVHRTRRGGQGTDFLDYRAYIPGDDVRRIDWLVFARLRKPFIRIVEHEETLYVNLLVDLSRSMSAGSPRSKAELACQLACGLAYITLSAGDHVTCFSFSDKLVPLASNLHGRSALTRLVRSLQEQPTGKGTDIHAMVHAFCRTARHRGLVILLSDFLVTQDVEEAIRILLAKRFKVLAVQILDDSDWCEGLSGPLRLVDSETGRKIDVIASPKTLSDYRGRLRATCERLESYCLRHGQFYLHARTRENYLELLARGLRQQGLLR